MAEISPADAYQKLLDRAERVGTLETMDNLLFWDQQVMMPPGGTPARSTQRGLVSSLQHEALTGDDVEAWLDAVADANLDDDEQAVVREVRREHERKAAVDRELNEEINSVISAANDAWEEAKENDDFDTFAPTSRSSWSSNASRQTRSTLTRSPLRGHAGGVRAPTSASKPPSACSTTSRRRSSPSSRKSGRATWTLGPLRRKWPLRRGHPDGTLGGRPLVRPV